VLPDMTATAVEVPLEVPGEPGRYEVRIALRQPGLGWFGVRLQAVVDVVPAAGVEDDAAAPHDVEGEADLGDPHAGGRPVGLADHPRRWRSSRPGSPGPTDSGRCPYMARF
jgi:hypothetical protein